MKSFTISLFFTVLLSLLIIYLLYPLNKGATALVFFLSGGFVLIVKSIINYYQKKK